MSERLERTLAAMEGALREHVLPRLDDGFARGQVYGVIYMLRHLGLHADWAVPPLQTQIDHLRELQALQARLQDDLQHAPAAPPELPACPAKVLNAADAPAASGARLAEVRDAGTRWLDALMRWHFEHGAALGSARSDELGEAIHRCAWALNNEQARLTPRPMFSQISTGQEP